jgi:predicted ATPase
MRDTMLTHIRLKNYRSFIDAEVDLAPFTLVVGANGAGKTNFLRAFADCGPLLHSFYERAKTNGASVVMELPQHMNLAGKAPSAIEIKSDRKQRAFNQRYVPQGSAPGVVELFHLSPDKISEPEVVVGNAFVRPDGTGTTQTLEALKNGDREAVFEDAEDALKKYVPEIEKLSFITVAEGKKRLQVREKGIQEPVPGDQLSEGTRLIIALLAIVHQPEKPPVICLEDVDRGMHPRVFEMMVELMGRIAREQKVQIIATTHNPYLVDCFQDKPEAVVIVEKKDGASTLATLAQKMAGIDYDKTDAADMPLGNLWFSGFVGGVPEFLRKGRK